LDPKIAELCRQFVLVRLTSLRGANLDVFDFDYDLTWMAFFLSPDERVLGRFGGRMPDDTETYRTIDGLRFAMDSALKRHHQGPPAEKPPERPPRTVDQYPGITKFAPNACAHCHHAYDLRREMLQEKGTWTLDEVWVYPLPENVGWTLAIDPGNSLTTVAPGSSADAAGMKKGDVLLEVNHLAIATFTDVQYSLHKAPAAGELPVKWTRAGRVLEAALKLQPGWRQTDISWRRSLKSLEPASGLNGDDLTVQEKQQLGLPPKALAFRQGNFPARQARQAGIQQNDIVIGVDGKTLEMTARQFDAFIRLNYRTGDTVSVNILREGKRLELRMKLTG
jgi:serine protease Do